MKSAQQIISLIKRLHIYRRGVFRCGMWPSNRSYLPMSNVVTHSAQTCKYFIKIIYNPFRHILHKRRIGWQPPGELSNSARIYVYILTENPEENGVNGGFGEGKNRICSRSDDSRKVDEQEGGESSRKLGPSVRFLAEIRFCGLARVLEIRRGAKCVSNPLRDRWSLGELRSLANPLLV